jgi:PEGA domain
MRRAIIALMLVAACHEAPQPVPKSANDVTSPSQPAANDGGAVSASPAPVATTPAEVAPPRPKPARVRIVVRSNPPKALVSWGKKKLGPTPVILDRPRESGPMDFIVRSQGYFPIHTRAYTFKNDTVWVKLTKLSDKMTLFGAKQELVEPSPSPAPVAQ